MEHKLDKLDEMINAGDSPCEYPGCKTLPIYNYPNEKTRKCCKEHKQNEMANDKDMRCKYTDCFTIPIYNYPNGKHKVYVYHRTCQHDDCIKRAYFGYFYERIK